MTWNDIAKMFGRWLREFAAEPKVDGPSGSLSVDIAATGYSVSEDEAEKRGLIVNWFVFQEGDKYAWGGKIPASVENPDEGDCSGYTQRAYVEANMDLYHGAAYQFEQCLPVREPLPGDLGFLWSTGRKCIGHVMMYTDGGMVTHSVGGRGVVVDSESEWTDNPRWRGWRRHPDFARSLADRPASGPEAPGWLKDAL